MIWGVRNFWGIFEFFFFTPSKKVIWEWKEPFDDLFLVFGRGFYTWKLLLWWGWRHQDATPILELFGIIWDLHPHGDTINSVKLGFCIPVGRSQLGNPSSYGFLWIPWASHPGPIHLSHRSYWKVDRQILGLAWFLFLLSKKDSKKRTHFYL